MVRQHNSDELYQFSSFAVYFDKHPDANTDNLKSASPLLDNIFFILQARLSVVQILDLIVHKHLFHDHSDFMGCRF